MLTTKQPKVLITEKEFEAFLATWPETIASLTEAWMVVRDAIVDTVSVFAEWLEENGIEMCECHAESLTYKGICPRCDQVD